MPHHSLLERVLDDKELAKTEKRLHQVTYKDPRSDEPFEEKNGLLIDSGGFCAIIIDERTENCQQVIKSSNLNGAYFLFLSSIPFHALKLAKMQHEKRIVTINGAPFDVDLLIKLLTVIGFHNVAFYQNNKKDILGIKTNSSDLTKKAVIAPLRSLKEEIDSTKNQIQHYVVSLEEIVRRDNEADNIQHGRYIIFSA